ncbi:MAG TPA: PEP-CTERM sorting domain-containing protein [Tepidisphaeraceae bacterium]|nr:PEP-CTERM sorting domain-containing protein [Tepidisphaeraceae bacterium]
MKCKRRASALPLSAAVGFTIFAFAGWVSAATMTLLDSGVQAYFGSQGSVYEASDPVVSPWTAPGTGPYTPGLPLPNVPGAPTPLVFPSPSGNPFGGPGYTSNFNDGFSQPTIASSTIQANFNPSPTVTSDANIQIPSWVLAQSPGSPSYAYEQLDFAADYMVSGGVLAGSTPNFPLYISGNTSIATGVPSYAQLDGVITYTWAAYNTFTGVLGAQQSLGQLSYSFLQPSNVGPFSGIAISSGTLSGTPAIQGLLEITGEIWVAGDPYSINVSSVPEPTSIGLLAIGLGVIGRRKRQR